MGEHRMTDLLNHILRKSIISKIGSFWVEFRTPGPVSTSGEFFVSRVFETLFMGDHFYNCMNVLKNTIIKKIEILSIQHHFQSNYMCAILTLIRCGWRHYVQSFQEVFWPQNLIKHVSAYILWLLKCLIRRWNRNFVIFWVQIKIMKHNKIFLKRVIHIFVAYPIHMDIWFWSYVPPRPRVQFFSQLWFYLSWAVFLFISISYIMNKNNKHILFKFRQLYIWYVSTKVTWSIITINVRSSFIFHYMSWPIQITEKAQKKAAPYTSLNIAGRRLLPLLFPYYVVQ